MPKKNVFFIGLDDFNRETLSHLPQADECNFLAALEVEEIRGAGEYDIPALVDKAAERMEAQGAQGVASFYDFPGTLIAAILAQRLGLPGPDLEPVFKCEHKYWSRLEQQKVISDNIPNFRAFDPKDDDAFAKVDMIPPFWIKPVKSFRSYLAFNIQDERSFREAIELAREDGGRITGPFIEAMRDFGMPEEIADEDNSFIAESTISGAQCTVEGYVYQGHVTVYGVVDSIREPDGSSFSRYEYPSMLPLEVQHRLIDVARAAITQMGYDNAPFNIEFFYDPTGDHVWLLEINTRASQSHADLFYKVHGVSHMSAVVDLALGRKPKPFPRHGEFNMAAHFFIRSFEPGLVVQAPTQATIDRLKRRQPGTRVRLGVKRGVNLEDLQNQDSYSFELAEVYIGARDQMDLLDKFDEAQTAIHFEIERPDAPQEAATG
jgi:biotin carboxylase